MVNFFGNYTYKKDIIKTRIFPKGRVPWGIFILLFVHLTQKEVANWLATSKCTGLGNRTPWAAIVFTVCDLHVVKFGDTKPLLSALRVYPC